MAKAISKPLSFSTTLRNPHRIADFLFCIKSFDGQVLTNDVIHLIIKEVLRRKVYYTMPELKNDQYVAIFNGDDEFNDDQLEDIIQASPQKHQEKGFDYGWPSRFDTWYELLKEFGFLSYSFNSKITITEAGKYLLGAVVHTPSNHNLWEYNENAVQSAMLNAMVKYQIDNPFCKNSNHNKPLILLLQTIELLKSKISYNGLSRGEISFLICWPNDDANELANYIIEFRKEFGVTTSDEQIYDKCLSLLGVGHDKEKRFKMSQITGEAVDEYIRKMRITGIISLRGNGRFIDANTFEASKIQYILKNYSFSRRFDEKDVSSYMDYMGAMDKHLIFTTEEVNPGLTTARKKALINYSSFYDDDKLTDELDITCSKRNSHDDMLKLIEKPTRFEFLISVLLCKKYGPDVVNPNYSVDDEGLPTHTAGGGEPDIVCEDIQTIMLVEVSLMLGRSDQINNEIIPIQRHLKEFDNPASKEKDAIFVAPRIHPDTRLASRYARMLDHINVFTSDCAHFQNQVHSSSNIKELCLQLNQDAVLSDSQQ